MASSGRSALASVLRDWGSTSAGMPDGLGLHPRTLPLGKLPRDLKNQFIDYTLSVENIGQAEQTELIGAFEQAQ